MMNLRPDFPHWSWRWCAAHCGGLCKHWKLAEQSYLDHGLRARLDGRDYNYDDNCGLSRDAARQDNSELSRFLNEMYCVQLFTVFG
jgi:hypothetical protein